MNEKVNQREVAKTLRRGMDVAEMVRRMPWTLSLYFKTQKVENVKIRIEKYDPEKRTLAWKAVRRAVRGIRLSKAEVGILKDLFPDALLSARIARDVPRYRSLAITGYSGHPQYMLDGVDVSNVRNVRALSPYEKGDGIDLTHNEIQYPGELFTTRRGGDYLGTCNSADVRHERTLDPESSKGRMILLYLSGKPFAYIKHDGNEYSVAALRTVRDKNGKTLFVKGVLCSIGNHLTEFILDAADAVGAQKIYRTDIEEAFSAYNRTARQKQRQIHVRPYRFLQNPHAIKHIDALTDFLEGETPVHKSHETDADLDARVKLQDKYRGVDIANISYV